MVDLKDFQCIDMRRNLAEIRNVCPDTRNKEHIEVERTKSFETCLLSGSVKSSRIPVLAGEIDAVTPLT